MVPRAAVLPAPLLVLMREFMRHASGQRKSQLLARDRRTTALWRDADERRVCGRLLVENYC